MAPRPDSIVVGAGVAGSSTAWHLARAGRRALLLEAEQVVLANGLDARRLLMPLGLDLPLSAMRYQAAEPAPAPFALRRF